MTSFDSAPGKPRVARKARRHAERVPQFIEHWSRVSFSIVALVSLAGTAVLTWWQWPFALLFLPVGWFAVRGVRDMVQGHHALLRNYPVLGHLRYLAESIRPELRQYFVESDYEATPFSREMRSIVYRRAKNVLDTVPFGTKHDVYEPGYEWLAQSLAPVHPDESTARVVVGEGRAAHPYSASIFNISAMSFGSLSKNAVLALNEGAAMGGFYHNTGEGGLSPYHERPGGDLVWQIGTGYFGCRSGDGGFDESSFVDNATKPSVKMIEVKLSQGAKPAHGGILPGEKVTEEIARIRRVAVGETVVSPPAHTAFSGPKGLLEFVAHLRELSGGKPAGFKLCIGRPEELVGIVKAIVETGVYPDFITVDGGEGGTGAAPLEFSNAVGMPLNDALPFVDNVLRGAGVRDRLRIISAGKIATGFHVVRQLALGADMCNSARGMMFALGCIQALKCNTNMCPTGVATQDRALVAGLSVADKAPRVANFHRKTVESVLELVGAAGLTSPADLTPAHIHRRISDTAVQTLDQIYPQLADRALIDGGAPESFARLWASASTDHF